MIKLKFCLIVLCLTTSFYFESYADKVLIWGNLSQWTEAENAFWEKLPDLSHLPDTFEPSQRLNQDGAVTDQSSGDGFVGFAKAISTSDNTKTLLNFKNGWIQEIKFWDGNGTKRMESNWKDGLQHGETKLWHPNGQIKEKCNFLDGKLEGLAIGWHANGEKQFEVILKNGQVVESSK